jgi:hypothetical protein
VYSLSAREDLFLPEIMSSMIFGEKRDERETDSFFLSSRLLSCSAKTAEV